MITEHYYGFEPDENYVDPDFPEPDEEVIDWDEDYETSCGEEW